MWDVEAHADRCWSPSQPSSALHTSMLVLLLVIDCFFFYTHVSTHLVSMYTFVKLALVYFNKTMTFELRIEILPNVWLTSEDSLYWIDKSCRRVCCLHCYGSLTLWIGLSNPFSSTLCFHDFVDRWWNQGSPLPSTFFCLLHWACRVPLNIYVSRSVVFCVRLWLCPFMCSEDCLLFSTIDVMTLFRWKAILFHFVNAYAKVKEKRWKFGQTLSCLLSMLSLTRCGLLPSQVLLNLPHGLPCHKETSFNEQEPMKTFDHWGVWCSLHPQVFLRRYMLLSEVWWWCYLHMGKSLAFFRE